MRGLATLLALLAALTTAGEARANSTSFTFKAPDGWVDLKAKAGDLADGAANFVAPEFAAQVRASNVAAFAINPEGRAGSEHMNVTLTEGTRPVTRELVDALAANLPEMMTKLAGAGTSRTWLRSNRSLDCGARLGPPCVRA